MSDPKRPEDLANPPGVEFVARDPNSPAFWDERFERGFTPWDQAGVPAAFKTFAARHPQLAVLIPGCGNAWEALWLAREGRQVQAIDFSPAAVANARAQLGAYAQVVEQADFFAWQPPQPPGWIYERAFLCALPLARRNDYAQRMAELLPAGALLAGFYFLGKTSKGPPFGIERAELDALLSPSFELLEDEPVSDSIEVFQGRERWLTWRRRAGR
ncbi:methyltransferase domain-containing protein [Paraburkholderia sp. DHOC27]|uniref:methyltransferase domain-containing protein n=1 Tax=Paraburkholderia sp. DHOC27 TaxID=2303330 RepID=UPI000E3D966A|nr:methyltransferase domain-containing protein [Paraburkholderia sp. DHOC27]RFU47018.1 thiopurine S-methyltransferase [Paraburkholderia sp. DHOC27]